MTGSAGSGTDAEAPDPPGNPALLFGSTCRLLLRLGLGGGAEVPKAQNRVPDIAELSFEGRLAMLLDSEMSRLTERSNSALVASQVPSGRWHSVIPDETTAVAAVDRLLNTTYRIQPTR